jgi:hypothetical protein
VGVGRNLWYKGREGDRERGERDIMRDSGREGERRAVG